MAVCVYNSSIHNLYPTLNLCFVIQRQMDGAEVGLEELDLLCLLSPVKNISTHISQPTMGEHATVLRMFYNVKGVESELSSFSFSDLLNIAILEKILRSLIS